jgi:hypothetical protein
MHVSDSVDPDLVALHAIREDERKAANNPTTDSEVRANPGEQRTDRRKSDDQLHGAFDRSCETKASSRTLQLVLIGGGVKLGASVGGELDRSHERF